MRVVLVSIALLLVGTAHAGSDTQWWESLLSSDQVADASSRLFTDDEKRIIQSYFDGQQGYSDDHRGSRDKPKKKKKLPPGLKKKLERGGELPPGWQKKVARGEVLDADLYGQSTPLPEDLLNRLPTDAYGTELRLLGDRVLRIIDDTRAILDVFTVD